MLNEILNREITSLLYLSRYIILTEYFKLIIESDLHYTIGSTVEELIKQFTL